MRIRRVVAVALLATLACTQAQARTLDQAPPYLKKEGPFVNYPAVGMGAFGAVVGTVLSLPAVVVAAPIGWAAGDTLGYTMVPVSLLATGGAELGYHVGGAIPWALKNGFYDAPMYAVARIKGEPASGLVAQVEPPPVQRGDIQYLDTTPPAARVPVVLARQYSTALPPPKPPTSLMLRRQLSPFKPPPLPVKGAVPPPPKRAAVPRPVVPPPSVPVTETAMAAPPSVVVAQPVLVPEPAPVVAEPPVVAAPPVEVAAPPVPVDSVPVPVAAAPVFEPAPAPEVVPEPQADAEAAGEDGRPAIKKKKRKFSERFGF